MKGSFIEKRALKAGLGQRALQGGPVDAAKLGSLTIKTLSPFLQGLYVAIGGAMFVFGFWVQLNVGNMAASIGLVFIGFLNVAIGIYGRPREISRIPGIDAARLAEKIETASAEGGPDSSQG